jgi:hypothetical protein
MAADPLSVKGSDRTSRRQDKSNIIALGRGVLLRVEMGTSGMEVVCVLPLVPTYLGYEAPFLRVTVFLFFCFLRVLSEPLTDSGYAAFGSL